MKIYKYNETIVWRLIKGIALSKGGRRGNIEVEVMGLNPTQAKFVHGIEKP